MSLLKRCLPLAASLIATTALAAPPYRVGDRLPASAPVAAAPAYKLLRWEELVPKGWDPGASLKGLDLATLSDADPRAMEALRKMTEVWNQAPTVPGFKGNAVRIAGFVLPLERDGENIRDFLLVPYFGACIHTPPPPANQIIHVIPDKPLKNVRSMEAMWVNGTLDTVRTDSPWGVAGYRIKARTVELYQMPGK